MNIASLLLFLVNRITLEPKCGILASKFHYNYQCASFGRKLNTKCGLSFWLELSLLLLTTVAWDFYDLGSRKSYLAPIITYMTLYDELLNA